jgi:hypothetical protein
MILNLDAWSTLNGGNKVFFFKWKKVKCFQMKLSQTRSWNSEGMKNNVNTFPHKLRKKLWMHVIMEVDIFLWHSLAAHEFVRGLSLTPQCMWQNTLTRAFCNPVLFSGLGGGGNLCYSQSGDSPQEYLARFGYKLNYESNFYKKILLSFWFPTLNHE